MATLVEKNNTILRKNKSHFRPADAIIAAKNMILSNADSTIDSAAVADAIIAQLQARICSEFPPNTFSQDVLLVMATEIYNQASQQVLTEKQAQIEIDSISSSELDAVEKIISDNATSIITLLKSSPHISSDLINILVAFTAHALTAYHPSGWIRYNKKEIFTLAKLNRLSLSKQEELMQNIHSRFGLNMRVIGSNQPIPCYNLPWLIPPLNTASTISKLDPTKIVTSLSTAIALVK